MSFTARSFGLLAWLALASLVACVDVSDSGGGAGGSGGSGGDAAGPGSTSVGTGLTTSSSVAGSGATTGSATTGVTTSATTGASSSVTGTGGGDSTTSTSTGSTGSGTCDIFCSDFEDGALPSEVQFFPEYLRPSMADYVTLDSTGHSGSRSVKVSGTGFSQMLGVPVPSTFWGRIYLKGSSASQMGHNTYIAATTADGDPNNGEHIRIGEHQCQLELNRKSDDAEKLSNGGMYMCSGGVKLAADTWYCLEFYYNGPGREVRVFVDGTEVDSLHVTDWGPYEYKLFKFGFEKYHGAEKTMWYDDIALGTERMGCGT
ncbi:hypothetical protein [Sorangium sp. So ce1335]|uniref:hypothetical protein n=1 Tax=Sorangium sp. So ce1335 TaxID=3133335 RepID=UPI003F614117